jgi:hypothetical protein
MTDDMTITIDSEDYVLRRDGEGLQVGRRNGADVVWLDTVDTSLLRGPALEALERGDASDESLLTAVRGITLPLARLVVAVALGRLGCAARAARMSRRVSWVVVGEGGGRTARLRPSRLTPSGCRWPARRRLPPGPRCGAVWCRSSRPGDAGAAVAG